MVNRMVGIKDFLNLITMIGLFELVLWPINKTLQIKAYLS